MKWISTTILVQIQTVPVCPLVVDPLGAVAVDSVDNVVPFSEIFSEFVAGVFLPSSAGNPLASSAFAAASPSFGNNVGAAALRADILADALVAVGGRLAFLFMVEILVRV